MSRPLQLTSWQKHLASHFPDLPAAVVAVLALYSFGVLLAHACGLTTVVLFLSQHLGLPTGTLRKRLREFYLEAPAKSGAKQGSPRKDFDVTTCFAPLLRWLLSLWEGCRLPLAIDVTNLGERFHVLCISVVVQGVAIPVAWKVLRGGVQEPWNPHWQALLKHLQPAVPAGWTVLVLSDRGLESPELFRFIALLHWHPVMRVKQGGKFRPQGWGRFYYFSDLVRTVGGSFSAGGVAYTGAQLSCTLLGRWTEGHAEPWLLLTDLPPEAANALWYGLRTWIEQGFKVLKGGGWQWQLTRMEDPGRVERVWLVLAVASLGVVALGVEDEAQEKIEKELKELDRQLSETEQQAQARRERQQQRLAKQQAAQRARQERRQQREAAQEEQRQQKRRAQEQKRRAQEQKRLSRQPLGPAAAEPKGPPAQQGQQEPPALAPEAPAPAAGGAKKAKTPPAKKAPGPAGKKAAAAQQRQYRVSKRGLAVWAAAWKRGETRLPKHLYPQEWPPPAHTAPPLTEQDFLSQQTYP